VYVVFVEWSLVESCHLLLSSSCCGLVHRMSKATSTGNVASEESSNGPDMARNGPRAV
jgi:hypothetical protein